MSTTTTHNFCTLFDKNFLARGLALHASLLEQCPDFKIWMMCMDEESYAALTRLNLKSVTPIRLSEVEDGRMLAVKSTRTPVEYCWMFSSALPLWILENHPDLEMITYLDADMYFYASPNGIYEAFGSSSIMIIPHGFSDKNAWRAKESGIYNVGMMIFRNDSNGLECLRWWKDRVIEWCYYRYEDGKLGDQLYLNDWTTRFKGVYVHTDPGANVASWNIDRFSFKKDRGIFWGGEISTGNRFRLIFYHFHGLKIYSGYGGNIRMYPATIYDRLIYGDYRAALQKSYDSLRSMNSSWSHGCVNRLDIMRLIKQYITLWTKRRS